MQHDKLSNPLKIALFPNESKAQAKTISISICQYLLSRGVKVFAEENEALRIGAAPLSSAPPEEIDFAISLGGDGTILRVLHRHPEIIAPIIAINLGGLGFMADIPIKEIYPGLESLLSGNYTIQQRIMMEGFSGKDEHCFVVNDVVVHRASNPSLVDLVIHVDGIYLNTFSADGVIISTPSGSTAYSLAAGGPILTPELEAFVLTPICPHTISNRPIVLMPKAMIQIQYISDYEDLEITCDGLSRFRMATGEIYTVKPSKRIFKLISLPQHNYFSTLRTKLGWAGKLKA